MCDCLGLCRVAALLNVRVDLLVDLVRGGHVEHHVHDSRITLTPAGVDDLRWRLATATA
jgi:hypothetical protein